MLQRTEHHVVAQEVQLHSVVTQLHPFAVRVGNPPDVRSDPRTDELTVTKDQTFLSLDRRRLRWSDARTGDPAKRVGLDGVHQHVASVPLHAVQLATVHDSPQGGPHWLGRHTVGHVPATTITEGLPYLSSSSFRTTSSSVGPLGRAVSSRGAFVRYTSGDLGGLRVVGRSSSLVTGRASGHTSSIRSIPCVCHEVLGLLGIDLCLVPHVADFVAHGLHEATSSFRTVGVGSRGVPLGAGVEVQPIVRGVEVDRTVEHLTARVLGAKPQVDATEHVVPIGRLVGPSLGGDHSGFRFDPLFYGQGKQPLSFDFDLSGAIVDGLGQLLNVSRTVRFVTGTVGLFHSVIHCYTGLT